VRSTEPALARKGWTHARVQVAAAIEAKGAKALYVKADLTVVAEAENVITQAEKTFGRIDGLVNCAAVATRGEWGEVTEAHIDRHACPSPHQCLAGNTAFSRLRKKFVLSGYIT
jgi:NAD(P)-dependent dehydrogenase (short-subunit alcohol dehydrogenase family)